ncbi:MAG: WD40 repeat domain-containing protein, partial [Pseudomonadota bacterium]
MPTVARYDFEEPVVWAGFVDDEPIFALADGAVVFPTGQAQTLKAHDGLLAATATQKGDGLISGGEDGRIVVTNRTGVVERAVHPGKWIDAVAAGPGAAIGYAAARSAWILTPSMAAPLEFAHERAVEGVCFAPKGLRIACARYNGVTLHWGIGTGKPVDLSWDGAHTGVTFSPDGSYVVTTMTENALHGWKLDRQNSGNSKHMRMSGYP